MMLKVNFCCTLIFVVYSSILLTGSLEESSFEGLENAENQTTQGEEAHLHEIETNVNETEDVYDDYIKILIFEGSEFRTALRNKNQLWENGIVPYEISNDYRTNNKKLILDAMEDFHNKTCIRFRERRRERSYISIIPGKGCSAIVGKIPNRSNRVHLHSNCFVKGIIIHELMHALGFFHEQNRPDRDDYVIVVYSNIRNGARENFDKRPPGTVQTFNLTYDYDSVMHYGMFDFAVNRSKPTIVVRQNGARIGQRRGFSEKDVIKVNRLYKCDRKNNSPNESEERVANDDEDLSEEDNKRERPRGYRWFSLLKLLGK